MEKELKIAELASIWGVSVTTTWNRVKKMGLKTFIKKNETNKDINYIVISEEQINEYVINVNNNNNNINNNGYYEETLSNNNIVNNDNDVIDAEYTREIPRLLPEIVSTLNNVYYEQSQQIININNAHNEQLENVYNNLKNVYAELATHQANTKMLEDKKASEGLYLNEIKELERQKENLSNDYNELKIDYNKVNNEKENVLKDYKELSEKFNKIENEKQKSDKANKIKNIIIAASFIALAAFITFFVTINNISQPVTDIQETVTTIQQPVAAQAPQPARNISNQRKR